MIVFTSMLSCGTSISSVGEPAAIVPVTWEDVDQEAQQLARIPFSDESRVRIGEMLQQAMTKYGDKPFVVLTIGTDSLDGGRDGWRTCGKFTIPQLGVPADTLGLIMEANTEVCDPERRPDAVVAAIYLFGPKDLEQQVTWPEYKDEKMVATIGSVTCVN